MDSILDPIRLRFGLLTERLEALKEETPLCMMTIFMRIRQWFFEGDDRA